MPSNTKTALIFGANGSFGSHAAHAFAKAGWAVRAQTREGKPLLPELMATPNIVHTPTSITNSAAMARTSKNCDVIINALNPPYKNWETAVPVITKSVLSAAKTSGATILLPGNVYNFGAGMPPLLTSNTPHNPTNSLGKIRQELESTYREAAKYGVQAIILRLGDFLTAQASGNWFDSQMTPKLAKGKFTYPGKTNIPHAWAYLPDAARAAVALAEIRNDLPAFNDIPFGGTTITGQKMRLEIETALGRKIKMATVPWPILKFLSLFMGDLKGVIAMRYLWDTPHELDGGELKRLLPGYEETENGEVIRACVARFG